MAPSSEVVCTSCPHACMTPGRVDAYGTSLASWMGKASMSARSATKRDLGSVPFTWATMPVLVTWVWCSTPTRRAAWTQRPWSRALGTKVQDGHEGGGGGPPTPRMKRLRQRLDARLKGHGNRVGLSWDQAVQSIRQEAYSMTAPNTSLTHASESFRLHLDPCPCASDKRHAQDCRKGPMHLAGPVVLHDGEDAHGGSIMARLVPCAAC